MYREPLENVLQWPSAHVRLISKFLQHEPAPEQKIEAAIAKLEQTYVNMHLKKGAASIPLERFLMFRNAWQSEALRSERYTDHEKKTIATLMALETKAD
ncbi:MAG: hypothetical protein M3Q42_10420 [Pseudomonadota bacterium]|nr:hypothetical protein [Pseudomonadota bacterium]